MNGSHVKAVVHCFSVSWHRKSVLVMRKITEKENTYKLEILFIEDLVVL